MNHVKNPRRLILIAGVLLQFCYGLAYVWSVFQPYVRERFSLDTGSANMPFGIMLALFSLGNVAGGMLQKKFKPIQIVVTGNVMVVMGLVLTAVVPTDKGYLLNLTYGMTAGFGAGMAYNTTVTVIQKWFPDKRGFVTGLLICATGSFGLIMNPVAEASLAAYGYERGTLTVAAIVAVCVLLGSGWIRNPEINTVSTVSSDTESTAINYNIRQVLKTPQYYLITLSMMLAVPGFFLISPMLMAMGTARGLSTEVALIGVMIVSVMNTSGRLIAPWISDNIGTKPMLVGLFGFNMLAVLLVSFMRDYAFIGAVAAVGFSYGGFMGMYPTVTADYFGVRYNGINYGAVLIGYGISSLGCPYLVKAVQSTSMGTVLSLVIAALASVLGMLLILVVKKPKGQALRPDYI